MFESKIRVLSSASKSGTIWGIVKVPSITIFPVPVILLPLRSKLPPNWGVRSEATSADADISLPPWIAPSPMYIFLVSVV